MKTCLAITTLILMSCSDTAELTANQMNEASKSDTLISLENEKIANQEFQKFPTADTMISTFFSHINEVERFIDPKQGVYCLESGPGSSPLMEKLLSKEDLMGKTPFLFLCRDVSFIKNQVLLNPTHVDFCNDDAEGYFIFDLKERQNILEDTYKITIAQKGDISNDTLLIRYNTIDRYLNKSVVVSFHNKHGETTMLKFYFSIIENKMILSIIDLRECGV